MAKLLIVDDDLSLRQFLTIFLCKEGYEVEVTSNGERALGILDDQRFDVVLTDLRMPRMGGLELLAEIKERAIPTQVIVMTAYSTTETALEAMRRGAYDYIIKPFQLDAVRLVIEKCLEKGSLIRENQQLKKKLAQQGKGDVALIYRSEAMAHVEAMVDRVASTPSSVLLLGESGTGKEVVARMLHRRSQRAGRPFVALNCGAIPDQLMESELFGHVKGAFTGATTDKKGLFEAAHGGTLFLDEIGELSFGLQVKLLRVLQERVVTPVGSTAEITIDVRVVAATHKDMRTAVREGTFRADLYYRLNVIEVRLPALRERRDDILPLAEHFLARMNQRMGRDLKGFDDDARRVLEQLSYFGNVRELENIVERAVALETEEVITATYLPDPGASSVFQPEPAAALGTPGPSASAEQLVAHFVGGVDRLLDQPDRVVDLEHLLTVLERDVLRCALEHAEQNKTDAAARLGISFRQFRYKLAKLDG